MLWNTAHEEFKWNSNKLSLREKMEREINESDKTKDLEKAGMVFELWAQALQTIESKAFQWTLPGAIQDFGSNFLKLSAVTESVIDSISNSARITTSMVERISILQGVQKDLDVLYDQYFSVGESNLEIRDDDFNGIQRFSTIFTNVINLKKNLDRCQIELNLSEVINPIIEGLDELLLEIKNEISNILVHSNLGDNIGKVNTYINLFEISEEYKRIFFKLKNWEIQNYYSEFNFSDFNFNLDMSTANLIMDDHYDDGAEEDNYDI